MRRLKLWRRQGNVSDQGKRPVRKEENEWCIALVICEAELKSCLGRVGWLEPRERCGDVEAIAVALKRACWYVKGEDEV